MFCPNCGKTVEEANYCKYCGAKLSESVESILDTRPEPGTEAFEAKRAELTRRQIPHCPKCLSTHLTALHSSQPSHLFFTRFVCFWCGYEWQPYKENYPNAGKKI